MTSTPRNAPQTLTVKRKRNEASVDTLILERNDKRLKNDAFPPSAPKRKLDVADEDDSDGKRVKGDSPRGTVVWRRIKATHRAVSQVVSGTPPATTTRRFQVSRESGNVILLENKAPPDTVPKDQKGGTQQAPSTEISAIEGAQDPTAQAATPRKRPGASSALKPGVQKKLVKPWTEGPSEETIRKFEAFSDAVEKGEIPKSKIYAPQPSPSKFKPKAPKLRFKDRHPEQAAALRAKDPNAMDVDDEYVYDTYVQEIVMPDANGKIPEPQGTVGFIVISEEDEEWWFAENESDREFDTDDEDENAEDYYGNDYPEDELSSDDEFERDPYTYHRGEDNEEYDLSNDSDEDDARSDGDEDQPLKQAMPKPRALYWGKAGEQV